MSSELETVMVLPLTENLKTRAAAQPTIDNAADLLSLVGEVIENSSSDFPGRVLIRWRGLDSALHEHWLSTVRGLTLARGDLVLLHRPGNWPEWLVIRAITGRGKAPGLHGPVLRSNDVEPLNVMVDNTRIEIEGQDEVVLRCGKASITLRRNGRVIIRGTYVESRSTGTNRIKGGSVLIN
jgi:hypothetical protein